MIKAKDMMRKKAAVKPNTLARDVVSTLIASGLPGVAVLNDNLEVVGVITEFDLLGAVREGLRLDEFTADRVMTKNPVTADPEKTAAELIQMMLADNYTMMPVVSNGKFCGVVTRLTIMDAFASPDDMFYLSHK